MDIQVVEIVLIGFVILRQIYIASKLSKRIKQLKYLNLHEAQIKNVQHPVELLSVFDYAEIVKYAKGSQAIDEASELVTSSILMADNESEDTQNIIEEVNTYILKNDQNVINFNVIRDITDRNVNVLDEDINQQLPTPLYLGLAATMLGIVMGLVGMRIDSVGDLTANIGQLIWGVGFAMTASFVGVVLTTFLSTRLYKNAKRKAEREKNKFYSKLQAVLLPELLSKGETSIEQLNKNLSRFSKIASSSVDQLSTITQQTSQTVKFQNELIGRVEKLDVRKVATTNLEILERLERNLETFDRFSAYWERLTSSMGVTSQLVDGLRDLNGRIGGVEQIASHMTETIDQYHKTMRFFTEHLNIFENGSKKMEHAVSMADVAFSAAVDELKENNVRKISELRESGGRIDIELENIGKEVTLSLKEATHQHLKELYNAYNNNLPEFSKLNHLEELKEIRGVLSRNSPVGGNGELTGRLDTIIKQNKELLDFRNGSKPSNKFQEIVYYGERWLKNLAFASLIVLLIIVFFKGL